jgi:hypothetical protein
MQQIDLVWSNSTLVPCVPASREWSQKTRLTGKKTGVVKRKERQGLLKEWTSRLASRRTGVTRHELRTAGAAHLIKDADGDAADGLQEDGKQKRKAQPLSEGP